MSTMRDYQLGYSLLHPEVTDRASRQRKAETATLVLEYHFGRTLSGMRILDVGGSSGIMAEFMAARGNAVTVIDVDEHAIRLAHARGETHGVSYQVADAMALPFTDDSFDAVLCCHVYEHIPDPHRMMAEIHRILRPSGVCYFTAGNRIAWREPHYGLPLLSVIPRRLADLYLRMSGRGQHYYEKHLTRWGLRRLVGNFKLRDATLAIVEDPVRFGAEYMIRPTGILHTAACLVARFLPALLPGYVWILEKPAGKQAAGVEAIEFRGVAILRRNRGQRVKELS